MGVGKWFMAAGALALVSAPVAAANPAASLSVAQSSRAASPQAKQSNLLGFDVVIIAMVVIAGLAIYAIVEDQSDDSPDSP